MSCMPPPSSKKRSAMMMVLEGTAPRAARPVTMYTMSCWAPLAQTPHSCMSQAVAAATSGCAGDITRGDVGSERGNLFAEHTDTVREDGRALGGFAFPERQTRRGAMGVFDEDAAGGFDALNPPAGSA